MDNCRANVKIVCKNSSTTKIFIDGKEVHGVQAYSIEQNATDKRTPILSLKVKCNVDLETTAVPLLPEPWSWFYKPKKDNWCEINRNDD